VTTGSRRPRNVATLALCSPVEEGELLVTLRYRGNRFELPPGEFVIGRTSDCHLDLDDDLVSRKHAALTVRADGVSIEDLASRNGVIVNGSLVKGSRELAHGDRISIGTQVLLLSIEEGKPASMRDALVTQAGSALPEPAPTSARSAPGPRAHPLELTSSLAEKAFAMGRFADAERLLQRPLADLLDTAHRGSAIEPELLRIAAVMAVRLAGATSRGSWVDYIIELHLLQQALIPQQVVDALYDLLRKVRIDVPMLRAYVQQLRLDASSFGPTARFNQKRIEGLESVARP
jgi:pSer/pThr/pTyr-binding forkhead associated (FHA) protein